MIPVSSLKKIDDLRSVLSPKPLNQYVPRKPFKIEAIQFVCKMVQPQDYLTSIHLKDGFLHVLVHAKSRKCIQFRRKNDIFQFKTLSFGLSLRLMVFHQIPEIFSTLGTLKRHTNHCLLGRSNNHSEGQRTEPPSHHLDMSEIERIRFSVQRFKSHLFPIQEIDHLGFTINITSMPLSVPALKRGDIRREAQATTPTVFSARLRTRELLQLKN